MTDIIEHANPNAHSFLTPTVGSSPRMDGDTLHATPVKRILDRTTLEVVGWLYEWNTGRQVPMWKDGPRKDVVYEVI